MLHSSRVELFAAASAEFINTEHPLKDSISYRQAQLLLPELSDPFLLARDECLLLFETAIRTAMGRENSFPKITPPSGAMDVDSGDFFKDSLVSSSVVQQLHQQYLGLRSNGAALEAVLSWIKQQQDLYEMYVPALVYLEWAVEDAVIDLAPHLFTASQLAAVNQRRFATFAEFEEPLLLFRSRVLQLFLLSLIEKCLIETLPRPRTGRKRKRK